jgi:TolB-like protein
MKKWLLLFAIVITLLTNVGVFSQELIVVVAPFEIRAGFSESDAETITDLFMDELSKYKGILKVVDRSDAMFNAIIAEMDFGLSDYSNNVKVAEFGQALNANAVVLGRMMMLGDQRIITARILDVRTTEFLSTSRMEVINVSEILDKLPTFTTEIISNLPQPPPPPLVNPFPGRWRSTITSNGRTLICILNFRDNGQITVEQYDTNKVTGHWWGTYTNDIRRGRGSGTYSFRESGNRVVADISLSISGVSHEFTAVTARGSFDRNNPSQFTVDSMKCEYFEGRISDSYQRFSKL